ncbi:MAG TPA: rhomboid family intramembrane serine protease [Rhizobiales bacterium]|nr:rhomboid family intramembrane serine protease [Hyphomicrobiales bacterium]
MSSEPAAINAPRVVMLLIGLFVAIHIGRGLLDRETGNLLLVMFSFIPVRYAGIEGLVIPGGDGAAVWSFVTYQFLHGSWMHLTVNSVWMLAFASPVAWRLGVWRFLSFSVLCGMAGAATHLLFHWGEATPVIGASAAISGQMAGALRFVFQAGGPLGIMSDRSRSGVFVPALGIGQMLQNRQVLLFLAVWIGLNLFMGMTGAMLDPQMASVAWEAHLGGLAAGIVLFGLFDPVRRR